MTACWESEKYDPLFAVIEKRLDAMCVELSYVCTMCGGRRDLDREYRGPCRLCGKNAWQMMASLIISDEARVRRVKEKER